MVLFFSSEVVQSHSFENVISAIHKFVSRSVLSNSINTCGVHSILLSSGITRESLQINDGTAAESEKGS